MKRLGITLKSIMMVLLVGCVTDQAALDQAQIEMAKVSPQDADKLFIVDCLLPGQIRKLGSKFTYLTARRPIKTTASDCEIRGGEYVAFDRANYATALKIWLPQAQAGDPEAQAYTGEIYEKGLGVAPDYQAAVHWYQKAAEKGNSRAQINLGFLYEKGLGVEQNMAKAMDWYRKASGLEQKDLPYAATFKTGSSDRENQLLEEIKLLRTELNNSRNESKALTQQLEEKQRLLENSLDKLQNFERQRDETRSQLNDAVSKGDKTEKVRLEKLLREKEQELADQKQYVASLQNQYQQKVDDLNVKLEEKEKRAKQIYQQLQTKQISTDETQLKMMNAEARLAQTEKQLLEAQSNLNDMQIKIAEADKASIENKTFSQNHHERLAQMERELAQSESERKKSLDLIKRLEEEKRVYEDTIEQLMSQPEQVAQADKPSIEIIDPPFVLTRGIPTVTLRSAIKEREIIGKATSPAGILSVIVNDVKNTLDDRGIFNASVKIQGEKTPVKIVAVDRNGGRESLDFLLTMQGNIKHIPRSKGSDEIITPRYEDIWRNIDFGNYYALIIGNNKYKKIPSLDTPINDAKSVDRVLREKYGFKTKLLTNADRYQILSALNEMRSKLTEKDNLLIYYAGHGELDQVNMRGHWLPVDADADNTANWISTVSITDILNAMTAKHVLVIADSCYSGAMTRASLARLEAGMSLEKKSEWLKAMLKAKSRTVLTSGGLKPVMDGGGGDHSVFANSFIKALKANNGLLEGQELYRNVSANIVAIAAQYGIEQVPRYAPVAHAGHEAGEFFFLPKNNSL